jgi:hypothetical protein
VTCIKKYVRFGDCSQYTGDGWRTVFTRPLVISIVRIAWYYSLTAQGPRPFSLRKMLWNFIIRRISRSSIFTGDGLKSFLPPSIHSNYKSSAKIINGNIIREASCYQKTTILVTGYNEGFEHCVL